MIRRLEIAQAMLHRPAILFLDEPIICLGLDFSGLVIVFVIFIFIAARLYPTLVE